MTLDDVRAIIGETATRTLCERLGGTSVYVPSYPSSGTILTLAIGHAAAARLCDAFAGEYLHLPSRLATESARRRAEVLYDLRRGLSSAEIARRHGLSARHVRNIREST